MKAEDFITLVKEAIDKFEKQGKFSKDGGGSCFYYRNNLRCIVGMMMPDDIVKEADYFHNKGTTISELFGNGFEWAQQFSDKQIEVLSELQGMHDNLRDVSEAVDKMREVIEDYEEGV